MNAGHLEDFALPPSDDALSHLLEQWAHRRGVGDAQAEAIRRTIMATPSEPGHDWWRVLMDQISAVVIQATSMAQPAATALQMAISTAQQAGMGDSAGLAREPFPA
jgi:hypothetical protein